MGFKKFVQAGRVVQITVGAHQEKLAVIVDIINGNQVIVDNSVEQVPRMPIPLKRLVLTDIILDIERGASSEEVAEKVKAGKVRENFNNTPEGQRRIKYQKKLQMTDFERFKVGLLLKTVSFYAEKFNDKEESQGTQKVRGSLITYNFQLKINQPFVIQQKEKPSIQYSVSNQEQQGFIVIFQELGSILTNQKDIKISQLMAIVKANYFYSQYPNKQFKFQSKVKEDRTVNQTIQLKFTRLDSKQILIIIMSTQQQTTKPRIYLLIPSLKYQTFHITTNQMTYKSR